MTVSRIVLLAPPRRRSIQDHAADLLAAATQLGSVDERIAVFRISERGLLSESHPTIDDVAEALDRRQMAMSGDLWHRVALAVPEGRRRRFSMELLCGYESADPEKPLPMVLTVAWVGRHPPPASDFRRMLLMLIDIYRPLWASLGGAYHPADSIPPGCRPSIGWDTFVCREYGTLPTFDKRVQVTPYGGRGSIIRALPEVLDDDDESHAAAIRAVEAALREHGALKALDALEDMPPDMPIEEDEEEEAPTQREPFERVVDEAPAATGVETIDITSLPAESVLPFVEAAAGDAPPQATPEHDAPAAGGTVDIAGVEQTIDLSAPGGSGVGAEPQDGQLKQITRYAALHADLAAGVEPRADVYARYLVRDDAHLAEVDAWWRDVFERQPVRMAQWRALYEKYLRELSG